MLLYAATSNPGKLAEFALSASTAGIEVRALPGLAGLPEPVEDAATFMGNAEKKARAYSLLAPGMHVFADDSGLEADALGGRPGVRSARFADDLSYEKAGCPGSGSSDLGAGEPHSTLTKDQRNNRCLLSLLVALPNPSRSARFVCALALARDGNVLRRAEGELSGLLLAAPRGSDGFGYDPLFLVPHLGLTLAELPREQKWQLSHRGNAFRNLLAQLRDHPPLA
jgi:XTP/dITP diphosphohydrolase